MALTVERGDFEAFGYDNSDYDDKLLEAFYAKKLNAQNVIDINNLRNLIGSQIIKARIDDSISEKDASCLQQELDATQVDKQELWSIGSKVKKLIGESKGLIADFMEEVLGAKGLDIDYELKKFKALSLEEKRLYKQSLRMRIEKYRTLYNEILKVTPDQLYRLEKLHGNERERFIRELEQRRASLEVYAGFLRDGKEHFSKESREEFMHDFENLSLPEQQRWINNFNRDFLKPRQALTERYRSLPFAYQKRIADFFELSRHEKAAKLDKTESELSFDEIVDNSEESAYVANDAKVFAKEMFRRAEGALGKEMLAMVKKHLKAEADLYRKFVRLPEEVRAQYPDFIQKRFELKQVILDGVAKEGKEAAALVKNYSHKLTSQLQQGNIGLQTLMDFERWFGRQKLQAKQHALQDHVFAEQMHERIRLRQAFEKFSLEAQQENQHFYDLSHHARLELYERLSRTQPIAAQDEHQTAQLKFFDDGKDDKPVGVTSAVTPARLTMRPKQHDELQQHALDKAVNEVKSGDSTVRRKIVDLNIATGIADLVRKSDRYNQGVFNSRAKQYHLESRQERELNRELLLFSGGKSVIRQVDGKAERIKNVDLELLGNKAEERTELREVVLSHPDEKSQQNVHNLQLVTAAGQQISGDIGKQKVEGKRVEVIDLVAASAVKRLEARTGKSLDEKSRRKIRANLREEDLKVDLKQAAGF